MSYMNDEWWDEDDEDYEEYEYDEPPMSIWDHVCEWFSHTRIGRLYWRVIHAIRHRYNDLSGIPF